MAIYKNPILECQCISFALVGYEYIKSLNIPEIETIQVKKYVLNNDDNSYSKYHYYIEMIYQLKPNSKKIKIIIDNDWYYNYNEFKYKFKPKQITKLTNKQIKLEISQCFMCIKQTIMITLVEHMNNIKTSIEKYGNII